MESKKCWFCSNKTNDYVIVKGKGLHKAEYIVCQKCYKED